MHSHVIVVLEWTSCDILQPFGQALTKAIYLSQKRFTVDTSSTLADMQCMQNLALKLTGQARRARLFFSNQAKNIPAGRHGGHPRRFKKRARQLTAVGDRKFWGQHGRCIGHRRQSPSVPSVNARAAFSVFFSLYPQMKIHVPDESPKVQTKWMFPTNISEAKENVIHLPSFHFISKRKRVSDNYIWVGREWNTYSVLSLYLQIKICFRQLY